jgi:glycolate oxidase iron-sulfur subunit
VLAAEGCDVIVPRGQGCCGALSLHTGRAAEAARFARRTIAAFEDAGVDIIVVNSAGCGSAMKEYGQLLRNAREGTQSGRVTGGWAGRAAQAGDKVRDFSEFLAELADGSGGARAVRHPLPVKAMYHEACHLGNAQGIQQQPRRLLRDIPGLELVEVGDGGVCCGSAGVYNLVQPEAARELGARKASAILATDAALVISANPGCSLQIARAIADTGTGTGPAVVHTAEVLDASLRGLTVSELTSR